MRSFGVSNHDNGPKAVPAVRRCERVASGQLAGGGDFRSGRLMHGVMRGIRDPWLLVDHRDAPTLMAIAWEVIEPRHRAIVDGEGEAFFRLVAEREPDRRLDRSTMPHRNHVIAGMFGADALDRAAHAVVEVHKTFAARRRIVDRRKPVTADLDRPAGKERRAVEPLPFAEMLFGKCRLVLQFCRFWKACGPDGGGGLVGPLQIACVPDRVARQDFSDRLEYHAIAGVAADVLLAVNAAVILPNRFVTLPPPPL